MNTGKNFTLIFMIVLCSNRVNIKKKLNNFRKTKKYRLDCGIDIVLIRKIFYAIIMLIKYLFNIGNIFNEILIV